MTAKIIPFPIQSIEDDACICEACQRDITDALDVLEEMKDLIEEDLATLQSMLEEVQRIDIKEGLINSGIIRYDHNDRS